MKMLLHMHGRDLFKIRSGVDEKWIFEKSEKMKFFISFLKIYSFFKLLKSCNSYVKRYFDIVFFLVDGWFIEKPVRLIRMGSILTRSEFWTFGMRLFIMRFAWLKNE